MTGKSLHFKKGLTKKTVKKQKSERVRELKRKAQQKKQAKDPQRGRKVADEAASGAMAVEPPPKKGVRPGEGSGTPGARAASKKVKPWTGNMSKQGARRHKWNWKKFGVG
mmetsp:Transcript_21662/g.50643  ORF Transcript_21662/g.50643 Transcript_21662/m.50643 type:complete len:110 (-) Transcript_21662:100-429(-)|eukprot:CAMPEP_0178409678 /NCGR_PEP_ID=MMETSP0689_2-20121128/20584_1 /TAXON_ID=160604 /ORGANISM="Amphidinium massartii, Strain CS-259" /LENGTH=109 /DNA_ID=CAMNT_0020030823 /DNA_START=106 /DNA_END=435 /DNA_ORIENTATION=+